MLPSVGFRSRGTARVDLRRASDRSKHHSDLLMTIYEQALKEQLAPIKIVNDDYRQVKHWGEGTTGVFFSFSSCNLCQLKSLLTIRPCGQALKENWRGVVFISIAATSVNWNV